MTFVKLELQNQDATKDSELELFWTDKQLLEMAC